jgi:glutamine---fructose-6-phosphate transaminase (isomerizing)
MCGIIGIVGNNEVTYRILDSLQKLEYRGYDSAGVATVSHSKIHLRKVVGKINNLVNEVKNSPISGNTGIGHTRWATHGAPSVVNAHPFIVGSVVVVHNGIIENHAQLRKKLQDTGVTFFSETDSEVIPNLINYYLQKGFPEVEAVKQAVNELEGAYAIAVAFASNEDLLIGIKNGAPMAIGVGDQEMYLGSDAFALSSFTKKVIYLEDQDIAVLSRNDYKIINHTKGDVSTNRQIKHLIASEDEVGKNGYSHYMQKEIFEQPKVLSQAFSNYYDMKAKNFNFKNLKINWKTTKRIYIVACGTSFNSALIAKYWFEKYACIPVEIDIASEFRYRSVIFDKNSVAIFISQSGETADTLAALKHVKTQKMKTVALVNVPESSIANAAHFVLPLYAGREIGVASTKAFTNQLLILAMLCLDITKQKELLNEEQIAQFIYSLHELPGYIKEIFHLDEDIKFIANNLTDATSMIYIGRGVSYSLALEGALKIKELSYIHAEGIAAGELKHGSIALIDNNLPVVVIAPSDDVYTKTASNIYEVYARAGKIIILTDSNGITEFKDIGYGLIQLPKSNNFTAPILYSIPLQLLAYHTACAMDKDIDQPRNLAKSVTVE